MNIERYSHHFLNLTDSDCQLMYEDMLQVIQTYTGCSDASKFYALNPFILQIWERATSENLEDNLP